MLTVTHASWSQSQLAGIVIVSPLWAYERVTAVSWLVLGPAFWGGYVLLCGNTLWVGELLMTLWHIVVRTQATGPLQEFIRYYEFRS